MTKVSRKGLRSDRFNFFLNNFWSLIGALQGKDQVKNFLEDLLTHTETKMFVKRIQIAKMLMEGHNYQEIKDDVKVTDATIAKISNILAVRGNGLETGVKYLQKIEKPGRKKSK